MLLDYAFFFDTKTALEFGTHGEGSVNYALCIMNYALKKGEPLTQRLSLTIPL